MMWQPQNAHTGGRILAFPIRRVVACSLALVLTTVAFYFTAWLDEDAYIDFRVVSNLLSGAGLVWNVGERVQAFTSPLWVGLIAFVSGISGATAPAAAFATSLACSWVVAIVVVCIATRSWAMRALVIAWMCGSQAYLDYSSSGLENPLLHSLLALAYLQLGRLGRAHSASNWALFSLGCGLVACTRLDALVLVAPLWCGSCIGHHRHLGMRSTWQGLAIGLLPLCAWEVFSLWYYGSWLPNSALAKLPLGYPRIDLLRKGWLLIRASAVLDPGTFLAMVMCPLVLIFLRSRLGWLALTSSLASLTAILLFGGDFMQGRFVSAPFVSACLLLLVGTSKPYCALKAVTPRNRYAALLMLVSISAGALVSFGTQYHAGKWGEFFGPQPFYRGQVADERSQYNQAASLRAFNDGARHRFIAEGAVFGKRLGARKALVVRRNIGMFGYAAGPHVYIVDPLALADPFLSRLPACRSSRAGHFFRPSPTGYRASLLEGENRVRDAVLARLFDDVLSVTRAPLTARGRLSAIWRLNNGTYRDIGQLTQYTRTPGGVTHFDSSDGTACPSNSDGTRILAVAESAEERPPWLRLQAQNRRMVSH